MSLPPELPASRHLNATPDRELSPQEQEHPVLLSLAFASVIVAIAADLLTAVVFTVSIGGIFRRCVETCVQPNLSGIITLQRVAVAVAVIGAVTSLIMSILVRRHAIQRPETADVARIVTVGIRLSALGVTAWGLALCGYLFFAVG